MFITEEETQQTKSKDSLQLEMSFELQQEKLATAEANERGFRQSQQKRQIRYLNMPN